MGEADVVLTSYNLLVRDYTLFSETEWAALVLDEAQAVKNPDTQVARAVRALTPPMRIALTGTPIENSVADLWSIEEFLYLKKVRFFMTYVSPKIKKFIGLKVPNILVLDYLTKSVMTPSLKTF